MSDAPLTNAAVERQRAGFAHLDSLDEPPADFSGSVTEDFQYEDHRSGGVNFGRLDATGWGEFLRSLWGLNEGRPQRSVREAIAAHGERVAAVAARIDYGNGSFTEFIVCLRLDEALERMERVAHYDIDDVNAALAEIDRLSAEVDVEQPNP